MHVPLGNIISSASVYTLCIGLNINVGLIASQQRLSFPIIIIIIIIIRVFVLFFHISGDRLYGLVVTVSGYRSRGPGSITGATRFSEK
jgi:hypothetical protein